jgi:hypothetical protein
MFQAKVLKKKVFALDRLHNGNRDLGVARKKLYLTVTLKFQ